MVSKISSQMVTDVHHVGAAGKSVSSRKFSNKKMHGEVPKKIHKAEREKLKRDYLNDLFLELDNALEPNRQNNGKASILGDATRLLRELLSQVECLRKENRALISESHYVTVEKKELQDENSALEAQIQELDSQLKERVFSGPTWNTAAPQSHNVNLISSLSEPLNLPQVDPSLQVPPILGPVVVIPFPHDRPIPSGTPSNIRRPHARYPTSADSWPFQLLGEQTKPIEEINSTGNGKE